MQPDFEQAAEALRTHAEALLAADRRWRELSALVSAYLRAQRLDQARTLPPSTGSKTLSAASGERYSTKSPRPARTCSKRTRRARPTRTRPASVVPEQRPNDLRPPPAWPSYGPAVRLGTATGRRRRGPGRVAWL
jgi:hypothetical protein